MTDPDLGDLLGLPAAGARSRARTRCSACSHPVYVDQLIQGMGRCCAERRGLIVRRWRLTTANPADAPALFERPEDLMQPEPFPQFRTDVAGLPPDAAHTRIVDVARSMIHEDPEIIEQFPDGLAAASAAHFRGLLSILERHAPVEFSKRPEEPHFCAACIDRPAHAGQSAADWPCADYRDAAAGLATGLPEPR